MNTIYKSSMQETRTDPDRLSCDIWSCDICMREIPVSEAGNSEATDYVIHYFGIECYRTWSEHR